jgi:hypothetical protein
VIRSSIAMLKHYENNLMLLKNEDLLHFLINDIIKYGFFQNTNYDNFNMIYDNLKVNLGLLTNLESEYTLELRIKEKEDKKKENKNKKLFD